MPKTRNQGGRNAQGTRKRSYIPIRVVLKIASYSEKAAKASEHKRSPVASHVAVRRPKDNAWERYSYAQSGSGLCPLIGIVMYKASKHDTALMNEEN